ncbi:MAG: hypothetical protein K9J37_02010 [Saprospiraceae bacterium]|nr:hypothetical protein [Saprospiraceae bacterium]MCF8248653.1 hypothetical protein [Saprospiraceae bacterium]MCF8278857.1 hypothetical protein [Bacteroidales bacterium]MCF8310657.1 hypothetical protein [Saprospiraceae bacterium]MCF8439216.1 hypothetical protein [Saprospiraceae bacterium]
MSNTLYIKLRYRGKLKDPADVQVLIHETEDICRSNGWKYQVWNKDWAKPQSLTMEFTGSAVEFEGHAPLKGISFSIGESETVWLTFQPDGVLQSLMTLADPGFTATAADVPWQRVKTGYDGAVTHLAVCKLFRYLAGKYFEVFEVMDESGYWDHGDDDRLTAWMNDFSQAQHQLDEEMGAIDADKSLSPTEKRDMSFRLLKAFGERFRPGGE